LIACGYKKGVDKQTGHQVQAINVGLGGTTFSALGGVFLGGEPRSQQTFLKGILRVHTFELTAQSWGLLEVWSGGGGGRD